MRLNDLPDDALRLVLRRLPPPDLLRVACVCTRWKALASSNEMWAPQLAAVPLQKVNLRAVASRGAAACRDYWCMQHWLRQSLPMRNSRLRSSPWQTQMMIALRSAERVEADWRLQAAPPPPDTRRRQAAC